MTIRTKKPQIVFPVVVATTIDVVYRQEQRFTVPKRLCSTDRTTVRNTLINHRATKANSLLVVRERIAQHKYRLCIRFS